MNKMNEIVFKTLNVLVDSYEKFKSELLMTFWDALMNTWSMEGTNSIPDGYATSLFTNHLIGKPGSVFLAQCASGLENKLFGVDVANKWHEFMPQEDCIIPGCKYFRIDIPKIGLAGADRIDDAIEHLSEKHFAEVRLSHAKNLEIVLKRDEVKQFVDTVTLITEVIGGKTIISTMYPGAPLPCGDVSPKEIKDKGIDLNPGDYITLARARELGFKTVKYI